MLRRIFGPRRDEVTGEWRRLRNEELNDLYSSPNTVRVIKSRRMRWAGHVAPIGEERGVYRVLVGKPEGRMDLQEVGCGCGSAGVVSGLPAEVAGIPDTTLAEPHPNSNTQQSKKNTANVLVQQHSRKLLKMDISMPEICWISKKQSKYNKWHLVGFSFFKK